jgi:exodeoxyribonuclease VII large subunit
VSQVVRALRELDSRPEVDVIVIARGGGALEDLLPFNSEELIRAVAAAATPVVSAIGHEADRPLLDDVADLRASTPTDAAKRIVPEVSEELAGVRQAREQLRRCMERLVDRETDRLASLRSRPVLAAPEALVTVRSDEIERLLRRSSAAVSSTVVRAADQLEHLKAQVRALSPQKTLDRGYAVVELADALAASRGSSGHVVVRRPAEAPAGTPLSVRVAEGRFGATSTGALEQHKSETGESND